MGVCSEALRIISLLWSMETNRVVRCMYVCENEELCRVNNVQVLTCGRQNFCWHGVWCPIAHDVQDIHILHIMIEIACCISLSTLVRTTWWWPPWWPKHVVADSYPPSLAIDTKYSCVKLLHTHLVHWEKGKLKKKKLFVQEENKSALHVRSKNFDILTTKLDE